MAFTVQERGDIRRLTGYPPQGDAAQAKNWRHYQAQGLLEFRTSYLTGTEEVVVRRYLETLAQLERPAAKGADRREHERLFDGWRRRLCGFLGVPPGPGIAGDTP